MAKATGMLTLKDLEARVRAGSIDTVVVAFTDHYGSLHGKRFDAVTLAQDL